MKKKYLIWICMIFFFSVWMNSPIVFGASAESAPSRNIMIEKGENISSDLIGIYDSVDIKGELQGNLFALSNGATCLEGHVEGMTALATEKATIAGTNTKDLLIASLIAEFRGAVIEDDVLVLTATSAQIDEKTKIMNDAYIFSSGTVVVDGSVGGDVFIMAKNVVFNGTAAKNVKIYSDDIQIGSKAVIEGQLIYYSALNARVDDNAFIADDAEQRPPLVIASSPKSALSFLNIGSVVVEILFLAFLAWIIMRLWPNLLPASSVVIKQKPFVTFFVGIGIVILLLILSVLLAITVVMMVPSFFLLGVFFFSMLLSILPVAYLFSALYHSKTIMLGASKRKHFVSMLLAIALLEIFSMMPFIGFGISMLITGWGVGSFAVLLRENIKMSHRQNGGNIDGQR
ncbi:MAG: polymer-forming cytoskeletal protein [Eubacteriaceae bacterium]|jgi:cytoskeletal protein CcmA (bactofilin family)|nr:polymer-forming cytoskeletal protein [Eubacteriaceae bacterium]